MTIIGTQNNEFWQYMKDEQYLFAAEEILKDADEEAAELGSALALLSIAQSLRAIAGSIEV